MSKISKWRLRNTGWMALALLSMSGMADAHHSAAMFDHDKIVTLQGTIKSFEWTNPHVWVWLVVSGPDGDRTWGIEANDPSGMSRIGWNHRVLVPGDKVGIDINPRKDGQLSGILVQVRFPDGRILDGGGPPRAARQ